MFERSIAPHVQAFQLELRSALELLIDVGHPERYRVAALDEHHVVSIVGKPSIPKTNYVVDGCCMYDEREFEVIRATSPSAHGELEITAVNRPCIDQGALEYGFVEGRWTDAGTFESWQDPNTVMMPNDNRNFQ